MGKCSSHFPLLCFTVRSRASDIRSTHSEEHILHSRMIKLGLENSRCNRNWAGSDVIDHFSTHKRCQYLVKGNKWY